ncbi:hypothetical protein Tco_0132686 [Tanacetum coccineum]
MQDCKPISTPFPTNIKLSSKMSPSSEKERMKMSRVPYASAICGIVLCSRMICTCQTLHMQWEYCDVGTLAEPGDLERVNQHRYVAAAQASKEAVWLKMLLEELGHEQEKITLFCDNQSALYLARNPAFHSKTKHIRVQYHFVREKVEEGTVDMQKIHTDDNVADYMTKAINCDKFIWCRSSCGLAET